MVGNKKNFVDSFFQFLFASLKLVLLLIALNFATLSSAHAATCTWTGGTSTAWSTAGNWSSCGGGTPGSSDDVVINVNTNPPVLDLSGGGITINSLSIGASSTASLTISNGDSNTKKLTVTTDVTIGASGTLQHTANTNATTHVLNLDVGGNFTVVSGGRINLDGKGFSGGAAGACGNNGNGTGPGTGFGCGSDGAGGGGHGGAGGYGGPSPTRAGGAAYGSVTAPVTLGSGGGSGGSGTGGNGGGALKLNVTGTLDISGSTAITANGTVGGSSGGNTAGGGGAGGSIYITAGTFQGSGSLVANGGDGGNSSSTNDGGGGAGGRVAVYYTTSTWNGSSTAYGGNGNSGTYGGAGTVYVKDNNAVTDTLTLNNNGHAAGTFIVNATASYTTLNMATDTALSVTTNSTLTIGNTGSVTWYTLSISSGSTLVANSVTGVTFSGTSSIVGTLNLNALTSLTIGNGVTVNNTGTITSTSLDTLTVGGGTSGTLTTSGTWNTAALTSLTVRNGATYTIGGTYSYNASLVADIQSGGTWTHSANTNAKTHYMDISLQTLTVSGAINVDSRGYQGGATTGCGQNGSGTGPGLGYGCGSRGAGGGAYGGAGGNAQGYSNSGGASYGSIANPVDLGSGGGGGATAGGAGGGLVRLTVSGTATISGSITANGGTSSNSSTTGGGGAGGTIYISANTLAGNGTLTANGGASYDGSSYDGGGGGGGRIAVYYTTSTWSGSMTAYGGNGYSGTYGGAGTVYVKDNTAVTDTLTLNNNAHTAGTFTVASTVSYSTLNVASDTQLSVTTNSTLTIGNSSSVTWYNLSVASGSTLVANSVTGVTFSGSSVSNAGTLNLNGITSLTIGNGVTVSNTGTITTTSLDTLTVGGGTSGTLTTSGTWNTAALTSLIVKNGATYTIGGTYSYNASLVADIQSGGTWTHSANTTAKTHYIDISLQTLTVSGTVNVDSKGYQAGTSASCGTNGSGSGGGLGYGCGSRGAGGGGYGGIGGSAQGYSNSGGSPYGSITNPVDLGSGGGGGGNSGGAGGGLIRFTVSGTATVTGSITANGGTSLSNSNAGGGGAGGTIYISANTLAGNGTLTANGGATYDASSYDGGGGGGGRIAVYYTTSTWSGSMTTYGGNGYSGTYGGAGTVYVKDNNAVTDTLTVNNNAHTVGTFTVASTVSYTTLNVASDTQLSVTTNSTLTIGNTSSVTWFNLSVASGSTLVANSVTGVTFSGTSGSIAGTLNLNGISSLTIGDGVTLTNTGTITSTSLTALTVGGGASGTLTTSGTWNTAALTSLIVKNGATYTIGGTYSYSNSLVADIQSGGTWTHAANTTAKTHFIDVTIQTLTVSGTINLNSKGYTGGGNTGVSGNGAGGGGHASGGGSGGGSHGGVGGRGQGGSNYGSGGTVNDSIINPTVLGSGGGGEYGNKTGGSGGGAAKLTVTGTLTVTGSITANGGAGGGDSSYSAAGGAGGAIWIAAGALAGNGSITANGGASYNTSGNDGGGGGGGRIAIFYDTSTWSGTTTAYGGTGNSGQAGGPGSVYIKDNTGNTDTLTLNNNGLFGPAVVVSATATYTSFNIASDTALTINNNSTLTVSQGGSATLNALTIASGSSFIANSLTSVVLTNPGSNAGTLTMNAVTTFTVFTGASFTNSGTVTLNSLATLDVYGTLTTTGTWTAGSTANLYIRNGGTLSLGGTYTFPSTMSMNVYSGGTLTHGSNTNAKTNYIDLTLANLTVDGSVTADSKGYTGGNNTGVNGNMSGAGGGNQGGGGGSGGGGHGGAGGRGQGASNYGTGGTTYGSSSSPATLGGGGGGEYGNKTGGAGGGAIKFTVTGTTTINGTITANGGTGTGDSSYGAGGGAGGSIWIAAATLAGTGSISANGGASYNTNGNDGGGGGGGRVALTYVSLDGVSPFNTNNITVNGGSGNQATAGSAGTKSVVGDNAPNTPSSLGPAGVTGGGWTTNNQPSFDFTLADADVADTVKYTILIDDNNDFSSPVVIYTSALAAQGATSFTVGQAAGSGSYTTGSSSQTLTDGSYYWAVRSTDSPGASSAWAYANGGSIAFKVDTSAPSAPSITSPSNNSYTNSTTPTISGSSEASATITVRDGMSTLGTTTANGSGAWSYTTGALSVGAHSFTAKAGDGAGNESGWSSAVALTIDQTVPPAPTIDSPISGTTSNDNTPTFSGTTEAGATITLYAGGSPVASTTADGAGDWTFTFGVVGDATYSVTAKATDLAGNQGVASSAVILTIDTGAPSAPSITSPSNNSYTNDDTPTLSGTAEAGSTVSVYEGMSLLGTTTASGGGAWSYTTSQRTEAAHTFTAKATDAGNNTSVASSGVTVTVDTTNPTAPGNPSPSASPTNDPTPSWSWSAGSDTVGLANPAYTVEWSTDSGFSGGVSSATTNSTSYTHGSDLADGTWYFRVKAVDLAGNSSSWTSNGTVVIDGTPPSAPSITSPSNGASTSDTTPTVSGTAEANATVEVFESGVSIGTTSANGSGAWSFTTNALAEGSYAFKANATDGSNNTSGYSSTVNLTVDTTAPSAPAITSPTSGAYTNDETPTLSGTSEANATISVYEGVSLLGTATANGSGAWSYTVPSDLDEGSYAFKAKATDAAANASGFSSSVTLTVDTTVPGSPSVTSPLTGSVTNDDTPTISGSAEANSTVTVYDGLATLGTTTANGSGAWSYTPGTLSEAAHDITAKATDAAGNQSSASTTVVVTVDVTAPAVPVISSPADNAVTNDDTPAISGTAEASATVEIFDGVSSLGTVQANGMGAWSFTSPQLSEGAHALKAKAIDLATNESALSSATNITVDVTAPSAPSISSPANNSYTSDTTPTLSGSAENDATVTVYDGVTTLGTTTANGSGAWSYTPSALSEGAHSFSAKATDAANNQGSASSAVAVTIDTTNPSAPGAPSAGTSPTSNQQPSWTWSVSTDAGAGLDNPAYTIQWSQANDFSGASSATTNTASYTHSVDLAEGTWYVRVKATDKAANASSWSSSGSVVIDVTAPSTPAISSPDNNSYTNDTTPTLSGTAEANATVQVYDGASSLGSTTANGSGAWTYTTSALSEAAHAMKVKVVDAASNESSFSSVVTINVDTTAPSAPSISSPTTGTTVNTQTPSVTGSAEANATVTVFDGVSTLGTVTANGSGAWSYTTSTLSEGAHSIKAKATDAANNTSSFSTAVSITVDVTVPAVPVITSPADITITGDDTPTFTGASEANATITVYDGSTSIGTTTANGSGAWTFTPGSSLSEGAHAIKAKATDAGSNDSAYSAVVNITVDITAPITPAITSPTTGSYTNDRTPDLAGTAEANATVTVYDGVSSIGTTTADGSGNWSFTPGSDLTEAVHSFKVKARDAADNDSAFSTVVSITVDATAPAAPVITAPTNNAVTNVASPVISGTAEANASVKVYDGVTLLGTATANGAGAWTFTPIADLSEGAHSLNAKATDASLNTSVASTAVAITVDITNPTAPVITAPVTGAVTNSATPGISGTAEANSTVSIYDGVTLLGTATASGTGAWTYTPSALSEGAHTFKAKSTDAGSNASAFSADVAITVDLTAPAAPVITSPASGSASAVKRPAISGTAEASATVSVYDASTLLGTTAASGAGAWSFTPSADLSDGAHSIKAKATDAATNTSAFSSAVAITVDSTAPTAPVITSPSNGTTTTELSVQVRGSAEASSTVKVYNGSSLLGTSTASSGGSWSITANNLTIATYSLRATATDTNGNTSGYSNTVALTIEDTNPSAPPVVTGENTVRGQVTQNGQPVEGARVTLDVPGRENPTARETFTDERGNYSFENIRSGEFEIVAEKQGTVISSTTTEIPQSETPTEVEVRQEVEIVSLRNPVFTFWNSFLGMINILELTNESSEQLQATITVYSIAGQDNEAASILATRVVDVPAHLDMHFNLAEFANFVPDSYGMVKVQFSHADFEGRMTYYRPSPNYFGEYEYAFSLPFTNPTTGNSYVTSNSYQPSTTADDQQYPVENWLGIGNLTDSTKQFRVRYFDQTGSQYASQEVTVSGYARVDVDGGHGIGGPNRVSLIEIEPMDQNSFYLASLGRYGRSRDEVPGVAAYRFGSAVFAEAGNGSDQFVPISNLPRAANFVEIANVLNEEVTVGLTWYDTYGNVTIENSETIPPHAQVHLLARGTLPENSSGSMKISPNKLNSVIAASMTYHYDGYGSGSVLGLEYSVAREAFATELYGSYNLYLGMANWLRVTNISNEDMTFTLTMDPGFSQARTTTVTLAPHARYDFGLHDINNHLASVGTYGPLAVATGQPGTMLSELLRAKYKNGLVDFTAVAPVR